MYEIEFNNEIYTKMSSYILCYDIFDIVDNICLGEYAPYYDKYIFKTDKGMVAAYKEDLSNWWYI